MTAWIWGGRGVGGCSSKDHIVVVVVVVGGRDAVVVAVVVEVVAVALKPPPVAGTCGRVVGSLEREKWKESRLCVSLSLSANNKVGVCFIRHGSGGHMVMIVMVGHVARWDWVGRGTEGVSEL